MTKGVSLVDFKGILKEQLSQNREILNSIDVDNLNDLIHELDFIRNNEGTIYIAGNGGSASTASHFMNDLCKSTRSSNKLNSFRAVSLSDNISLLTAISNDIDYDQIFRYQLEIFLDENDALFIISASGNSRNLIEAVDRIDHFILYENCNFSRRLWN